MLKKRGMRDKVGERVICEPHVYEGASNEMVESREMGRKMRKIVARKLESNEMSA